MKIEQHFAKTWLGKPDLYDSECDFINVDVRDFVVTKEGNIVLIEHDDMMDLPITKIARFATQKEVREFFLDEHVDFVEEELTALEFKNLVIDAIKGRIRSFESELKTTKQGYDFYKKKALLVGELEDLLDEIKYINPQFTDTKV